MRKFVLTMAGAAAVIALALAGFAASVFAHTGQGTITCDRVALSFSSFPDKPGNTVLIDVIVDGSSHTSSFTFNGPAASTDIGLDLVGKHTVSAVVSWNTNGETGSFTVGPTDLHCIPGTTTTHTTTTPAPPPAPPTVTVTTTVTTPAPTVTVTTPAPPARIVTKTKVVHRTKVVVRWKTRIVVKHIRSKCNCPPGTRLFHGKCHAIVQGKG